MVATLLEKGNLNPASDMTVDQVQGVNEESFAEQHPSPSQPNHLSENTNQSSTDSDSDTTDEDEEDEAEETDPPALKYTRIKKFPDSLFKKDTISTCLFHEDLFAFGTHSGVLHLMKPLTFQIIRSFKCHRASIMNITTQGDYFATASIDGTVIIGSLEDPSQLMACDFKRPVNFVVLDENYEISRKFVSGGMSGEVVLSTRNWLGNRVDTTLDKGHGPIVGIYIVNDILFWMNDRGITFTSISSKSKLLNIPFPYKDKRPDLYWPRVHFPETDRIIVSWYDHIWYFKVEILKNAELLGGQTLGSILSSAASSLRALPDKKVELEYHCTFDLEPNEVIVDISSFRNDQIIYLSAVNGCLPELKICDISTGEEKSSAEIPINNYTALNYIDYHMGKYFNARGAADYYIVSATDIVAAKELTLDDRFEWYMNAKNYYKAWEIGVNVDPKERLEIGLKHINSLVAEEKYKEAAETTSTIFFQTVNFNVDDELGNEFMQHIQNKWSNVLMMLISKNLYKEVAATVPFNYGIDHSVFDKILEHYLEIHDYAQFGTLIRTWPVGSYDITLIIEKVLSIDKCSVLQKQLAHLYYKNNDFLNAVRVLLELGDMEALDILLEKPIFANFTDKIREIVLLPVSSDSCASDINKMSLCQITTTFRKPLKLLIKNRYSVKLDSVVKELRKSPETCPILYIYLNKLSSIDSLLTANYEDVIIELYTGDFVPHDDHSDLLGFLKGHRNYSIDNAIGCCEKSVSSKFKELIYLWSKIGEWEKALFLLLEHASDDPKAAISFVKEHSAKEQDKQRAVDLWDVLIEYSLDKPKFITDILLYSNSSNDDFNPIDNTAKIKLISKLSDELQIPELQSSVSQVLISHYLTNKVNSTVLSIVNDEATNMANTYLQNRGKAKVFEP